MALRDLNIRTEAYPFDWIISPFAAIYAALDNDFKNFLTEIQIRPGGQGIVDYYGFHFTHDLPTISHPNIDVLTNDFVGNDELCFAWKEALPLVREKYRRRIERFRCVCLGQRKVFFIRSQDTKENVILLKDLIKNKYPKLDFLVIAIAGFENYKEPWNIECIKNAYSAHWHDPAGWGNIFKQADPAFNDLVIRKNISLKFSQAHEICCNG